MIPKKSKRASERRGVASFGMPVRNGTAKKGGWAGKSKGGVGGLPPHAERKPPTMATRLSPPPRQTAKRGEHEGGATAPLPPA